jgi:ubiquinone/menaquinone biosynthesis C-methylase UbiE
MPPYQWDAQDYEINSAQQRLWAQELIRKLKLRGDETVLDVGCGTGIISFLALQKGADKVVCGDISNYMLQVCRAKADRQGYGSDRIEFRQLDAESLPFEDASFDFVITGQTLGLIPDAEKAVKEMVRVVRVVDAIVGDARA